MSRVRVEKSIYTDGDMYAVQLNRQSLGGQYYMPGFLLLEDARYHLGEVTSKSPKQPNTGLNNNACRGGIINKYHNCARFREAIVYRGEFTCNRCITKFYNIDKLNVHHIDHNKLNDSKDNFEILCTTCHREHHNKRDSYGRFI